MSYIIISFACQVVVLLLYLQLYPQCPGILNLKQFQTQSGYWFWPFLHSKLLQVYTPCTFQHHPVNVISLHIVNKWKQYGFWRLNAHYGFHICNHLPYDTHCDTLFSNKNSCLKTIIEIGFQCVYNACLPLLFLVVEMSAVVLCLWWCV